MDVDAPDGEHYSVAVVRWMPPWVGVGALVSLVVALVRWGRWRVIVHRDVRTAELKRRWMPYAFRWYGPAMRAREAEVEFDRVMGLIRSGAWPDPTYVQR